VKRVWLASYPKSGNTWFRMLVANLSAEDGQSADINRLPGPGEIASAREPFEQTLLIEAGLLTHDEIDCLRPQVYAAQARAASDEDDPGAASAVRFVKVHDAYMPTPNGDPLLAGARGADGAIVIVRDPRDVAPSLAHHIGTSIDRAIAFMNDRDAAFCADPTMQHRQLRQRLGRWSAHVAGWLGQKDLPVHLVRYEDLHADAAGVFARALAFAGQAASAVAVERAVALSRFALLARQERDKGFKEMPPARGGRNFFRRGAVGAWRDELTPAQVHAVETHHGPMMRRLGYELTVAPPLACAG
jgi:Sulfotransferase domain